MQKAELQQAITALDADLASQAAPLEALDGRLAELERLAAVDSPRLLTLRAKWHLLAGDGVAALACFERALVLDPEAIGLQINTASARLLLGDAEAAVAVLRPLAAGASLHPAPSWASSLWNNLARAELELGDGEAALHALEALLAIAPDSSRLEPWLELVEPWIEEGQLALVEQLLQLLRRYGSSEQRSSWLPCLAELLLARDQGEAAATIYGELLWPSASTS